MTNIYELFKEEIWHPDDCTEYVWYCSDGYVHYTTDNNVDDLFLGNGDSYCGEVEGELEKDGYIIFTINSGCGYSYQAIFKMSNKQNEEKYWESYYEEQEEDEEDE